MSRQEMRKNSSAMGWRHDRKRPPRNPPPSQMMKLPDTTFLIHYWSGCEEVEASLEAYEDAGFTTTTLNIEEVAVGRVSRGELSPVNVRSAFKWVRSSSPPSTRRSWLENRRPRSTVMRVPTNTN